MNVLNLMTREEFKFALKHFKPKNKIKTKEQFFDELEKWFVENKEEYYFNNLVKINKLYDEYLSILLNNMTKGELNV